MFDNPPSREDVEPWRINVDHLLRDRGDLRKLFNYAPPRLVGEKMSAVLLDGLSGGPEIREVEQRLQQLDRVLERV